MTDILKAISYQENQLHVTLDFWGTKVLLKLTLPTEVILSIIKENYPKFKGKL